MPYCNKKAYLYSLDRVFQSLVCVGSYSVILFIVFQEYEADQ